MKSELLTAIPEIPKWRLQVIRILQLLGILAGFVGGADFLQLLAIVPPETSKWLLVSGPAFAAGIRPLILLVGDYLDDGVKNDSFKISLVLLPFLVLMCLWVTGCAGLSVQSPYGNIDTTKSGLTIYTPPARPIIIHSTK
jgi:formate hydrogenlyase subunit 4